MPRGRKVDDPWDRVRLPNHGSKVATPASLVTDLHYARLKIWERWTWERFCRLGNFLQMTPAELASVAGMPHRTLEYFERDNHPYLGGSENHSAALVLTMIEAYCCQQVSRDVILNPFPDLSKTQEPSSKTSNALSGHS